VLGFACRHRLNWTKVGLKSGLGHLDRREMVGLNWTKVGLKFTGIRRVFLRITSFELD